MKIKLLILLKLFSAQVISAQLTITPGAQLSVAGNMQLTLQNSSFINNGSFNAGNGMIRFTGNNSSSISGSQPIQFYGLEMNKSNNSSVNMQRAIGINQRILFTSGLLNLGGFNVDLASLAILEGEKENSRITGSNGGFVVCNALLDVPTAVNPGNLGAVITSSQNLGNTIIRRGHQSQVNGYGMGNSIFRYYEISPANNTNLNATLRLNYFDAELNGLTENSLVFFKSENGTNWSSQGFTSRNTTTDYVEKTGIGSFSTWTLSGPNNALPVVFSLFNARCEGNKVIILWKTAQEQNSSHFEIEKSMNGSQWTVIGSLAAAGNSNNERSYSFTDNQTVQNGYYRIAQYDLDGKVHYTSVLRASCNGIDAFTVLPNPAYGTLFVNIVSARSSQAVIKVFDSKGALVKVHKANVLQGSNQLKLDIGSLASGVYTLSAEWNDGQMKKALQLMKQ